MSKDISVILLGAGKSSRFESTVIKQNFKINKKTIINYSRDFFSNYFPKSKKIIAINNQVKISSQRIDEYIINGSSSRMKSLKKCLDYIYINNLQTKYTLVHDVARPVLCLNDVKKIINEVKNKFDGSTLGYPITNALKEVKNGIVCENILRDKLWSTFTPQIFKTKMLVDSLDKCIRNKDDIDDDIEALLLNNLRCSMVLSSPTNIKITYVSDIKSIKRSSMREIKIGFGYDLHKLCKGSGLTLAGVTVSSEYSIDAHSDGDIILHALSDAIYGSLAMGDIGIHFPSDSSNQNISSEIILSHACNLLQQEMYSLSNIDITVILEKPRLQQKYT